jgi:hypothetical protein
MAGRHLLDKYQSVIINAIIAGIVRDAIAARIEHRHRGVALRTRRRKTSGVRDALARR